MKASLYSWKQQPGVEPCFPITDTRGSRLIRIWIIRIPCQFEVTDLSCVILILIWKTPSNSKDCHLVLLFQAGGTCTLVVQENFVPLSGRSIHTRHGLAIQEELMDKLSFILGPVHTGTYCCQLTQQTNTSTQNLCANLLPRPV